MFDPDFLNSSSDQFHPPENSVEVSCLHCGQTYQSSEIVWAMRTCRDGLIHGFWVCPIEGCDGAGFGFDILPTDPNYRDEHGGWMMFDDDDELDDEDLEFEGEWNPDDDSAPEFPVYDPDDSDSDIPF